MHRFAEPAVSLWQVTTTYNRGIFTRGALLYYRLGAVLIATANIPGTFASI